MQARVSKRTFLSLALATALACAFGSANAADIKERTAKFPIVNPIDHPQGLGAQKFVEVVEKKSGGKIKIKIHASGALGGEQQVAAAMQGGTVEISMMSPAQLVGTIKEFVVLDFPFVFANEKQADAVLDGPFGKKLMDLMPAKGWVGLGFMEQGYRSISNSKRPINKLEDIKGLKLRTILNPLYVDMLNALGANAVPMPFPEVYTALETKTIDGQENPETSVDASKLYEVQKYFSADRHIYNPQMLMVSKKFWDSLSADEKKIFEEALVEARDVQRKAARAMTEKSRKVLIEHGMQLNEIAPAEIARMKEVVKPVTEKYAAQLDPALVKAFYAELDKVKNLK
ncbi:DctP family TRAP transporter solute-binding subunit [Propionivibrio dicarboxylicus]|uniref:Tripartite ATP-independent transporter solute receptor, DctP family n=1 Tax=Propionivibrio dicarboxylicus TaxID=83767 RepID=A0A1G7W582_9RHOO|nr:DctP family TRAP transporter solute-binding subunit [Propionivibrio dicarboxylicus]SDG67135.1 tripartite ATP-independent transporter solute receptor, DctP family [Propionivibrio dicarboxylicus]